MYDFESIVSRPDSAKWIQMYGWNPNVEPDVIPFSVADMELKHPPELIEGLKDYLDTAILGYASPTEAYKNSVMSWLQRRHNFNINWDWVINTPGVIHAFFGAVTAFTEPGDGVLVMTPIYYPFYVAIQRNNRKVVKNPLILQDNGSYLIDFDDLEAKAKDPKTKLLLLCSPHNPVGRVWTKEELTKIGDICLRNNVLVLSDEIHFDLVMPGYKHTVFANISEANAQNCIVCTAPSKTFNLAGLQASNIVIPNEQIRKTLTDNLLKGANSLRLGILGYEACRLAYDKCESWLDELNLLIHSNSKIVTDFFAKELPQIKVTTLEGTYLLWMDFRAFGIEAHKLEDILHNEAQVFFDEGYVFGDEGVGFERMNLACPQKAVIKALERLNNTMSKYK